MSTTMIPEDPEETQALTRVLMDNPPEAVLQEAKKAAVALQDVIKKKLKPVIFNGEQYLEFEDWQTLGRFYAVTACLEKEPEFIQFPNGISGFKATSIGIHRGTVVTRATAYCLTDEEKWRSRPVYKWVYLCRDGTTSEEDPGADRITWEPNPNKPGKKRPKKERIATGEESVPFYQLASMAQTRANAKALRNVLAWVAVLAGYKPTPAEELPGDADQPGPKKPGDEPETPTPRSREPGEDDESFQGLPPKDDKGPRIPKAGPALTDPVALGEELLRLTGDQPAAADLLEQLIGKRSVRGMAAGDVLEAWTKLAQHPTFGTGGGK